MSLFSFRLKDLVFRSDLRAKDIAKKLQIPAPRLSNYMHGAEPDFDTLIKIAKHFNVSCDYLLGETTITNFENLKTMTIDEMAEFFAQYYDCSVCIRRSCDEQQSGLTCLNGIKEWLLAPVKNNIEN